jgi:hypothetical protein
MSVDSDEEGEAHVGNHSSASYYYLMAGPAWRGLPLARLPGHVSLLAFNAFLTGPMHTQLALFPEDPDVQPRGPRLRSTASPRDPDPGDGELSALAGIHRTLSDAGSTFTPRKASPMGGRARPDLPSAGGFWPRPAC